MTTVSRVSFDSTPRLRFESEGPFELADVQRTLSDLNAAYRRLDRYYRILNLVSQIAENPGAMAGLREANRYARALGLQEVPPERLLQFIRVRDQAPVTKRFEVRRDRLVEPRVLDRWSSDLRPFPLVLHSVVLESPGFGNSSAH